MENERIKKIVFDLLLSSAERKLEFEIKLVTTLLSADINTLEFVVGLVKKDSAYFKACRQQGSHPIQPGNTGWPINTGTL